MRDVEIKESYRENEHGEKFGPYYKLVITQADGSEYWITPDEFETKDEAKKWLDNYKQSKKK